MRVNPKTKQEKNKDMESILHASSERVGPHLPTTTLHHQSHPNKQTNSPHFAKTATRNFTSPYDPLRSAAHLSTMTSEQEDAVFEHSLEEEEDDDELSSQSDDDLENDVLPENDNVFDDDEEEDDLNSISPSTSSPAARVPLAVPAVTIAVPAASATTTTPTNPPDLKRQGVNLETGLEKKPPVSVPQQQQQQQLDDSSRRLFQRLWTDEDEIELLQGFLEYTTQRGAARGPNNHHHHNDTALFYDQIKSKLQLDFNKNQLVEKLRRLKKKYRNVLNKIGSSKDFSFKSPHDQATFEISSKIWSTTGGGGVANLVDEDDANPHANPHFNDAGGDAKFDDHNQKLTPKPSRKRARSRTRPAAVVGVSGSGGAGDGGGGGLVENVGNSNGNVSVKSVVEEAVRSCLGPVFKEVLSNVVGSGGGGRGVGPLGMGGLVMNAMPLSFVGGRMGEEMMAGDEKWRKQYMLELEVYSKRLDLVQDQIRAQLEELRSMGER